MPPFDPYSRDCVSRGFLNEIADPWVVLVLGALRDGAARYTSLATTVGGISQGSLTKTLRKLEHDGIIARTAYPEIPPRVEYTLTDLGASLAAVTTGLEKWVQSHAGEILEVRQGQSR